MKSLDKEELRKALPMSLALSAKTTTLVFAAQVAFLDKPAVMRAMFTLCLTHDDHNSDALVGAMLMVHTNTVVCKNVHPDQAGNVDDGSYLPNLTGVNATRLSKVNWMLDGDDCSTDVPIEIVRDMIGNNYGDHYAPWDDPVEYGPSYQLFVEYVTPVLSVLYDATGWLPKSGASPMMRCKE